MDCSLPVSSMRFSRQGYWSGLPFPSTTCILVKHCEVAPRAVSAPTAEGSLCPVVLAHDPVHTALVALSDTGSTPPFSFGVRRPPHRVSAMRSCKDPPCWGWQSRLQYSSFSPQAHRVSGIPFMQTGGPSGKKKKGCGVCRGRVGAL